MVTQHNNIVSVLTLIKEGVVLFDSNRAISYANTPALEMFEQTLEKVNGLDVFTLLKQTVGKDVNGDADALYQSITSLFESEEEGVFFEKKHFSFTTQSGKHRPVSIRVSKTSTTEGVVGVLSFEDIASEMRLSEYQKQTKEALSQLLPALQKTATGDFSSRINIPKDSNDELVELMTGVRLMIDDLSIVATKKEEEQKGELEKAIQSESHYAQRAEEASLELRRASQHIELIIENLTSGLIEYDSEFNVRRMNKAAEKLLNMDRDDVLGEKVIAEYKDDPEKVNLAMVSYPVLAKEGKRVQKKMIGEDVSVHEITLFQPIRRELEVVTIPVVRPDTKEREGFIKVIRDITKEKEVAQSKSDFINIAAHQLRTPLSAVKWVLRMILDGDYGALAPSQRKLLDQGYATNEKMIAMVNDLLNVARIEDDRFGYVFKEANIIEAVSDVVGELRIMAEKGGIDMLFDKPSDIEPFVFDYAKIQLACQNLIGNAIKYTPSGGTVHVSLAKEEEEVVIVVRDTGVGIPKKQINKMFTKFFRAENAVRLQVGGSGLGLFIVKNIVGRHGGSITVQSVEEKGTTFTMRIPISHKEPEESDS